ncbi:hypothetical protein GCM10011581_27040 [Saccharopolyspora subtropica]|uniref:Uncharacterized protein n=1 Tax=Saccharopolyspora thermophila TaxID=89367 RepID=A0A917JX74_9PSEU|nr:hypothetical protein [Saccharopolyspora subtropica]GGI88533.1 hypothetical protein GCM10011581_27040 [Saccharopolyspora subtropica]
MHQHVHAELIGGPEDGRSFIIPAVDADLPLGQFTFPSARDGSAPCARYDRRDRRADGVWRYHYAGEQALSR